jgi:1-acyl-sn-glycerol-3-phosphate acyltransferase
VENVPKAGPVLLVANHPGTIDSLAIIASAPRPDIKAIAGLDPIIYAIENLRAHLIFVTSETQVRMLVMRQGIRHLQNGGCMLFFPAGHIEPDPAVLPGAADSIHDWHRSVEIFLKRVPETILIPVAISHILLPRFVRHILARLRRNPSDWQRTAEMLQILSQMVNPGKHRLSPRITFGSPISYQELTAAQTPNPTEHLRDEMLELLTRHVAAFNEPYPPLHLRMA